LTIDDGTERTTGKKLYEGLLHFVIELCDNGRGIGIIVTVMGVNMFDDVVSTVGGVLHTASFLLFSLCHHQ